MKIPFRDIESFVQAPQQNMRAILVYGPDQGLISERAKIISLSVTPDLNDPFNVASLTNEILAEDPARLTDEANAISMMGGKRLIKIQGADDKITPALKTYLENPNENALIVIQSGGLSPRSSLRKLCESAKNAAALPCYIEDERSLPRTIQAILKENNKSAERDTIGWLAINISGDRQKLRAELEKLCIYKDQDTSPITLQEAQACCGEGGSLSLDDLTYSVISKKKDKAMDTYNQLLADGMSYIAMLRSLQNHLKKLHITRARMSEGQSIEAAMKSLSPPIFFKQEPIFKSQINQWNKAKLEKILKKLMDTEAQCKKTGAIPETLCAQAILSIASQR